MEQESQLANAIEHVAKTLENFTEQTPAVTHRQHRMIAANQLRIILRQIQAERETQTTGQEQTS